MMRMHRMICDANQTVSQSINQSVSVTSHLKLISSWRIRRGKINRTNKQTSKKKNHIQEPNTKASEIDALSL